MTEQPKKLSRRDAIKLIGVAAGASALATLPTKWTKPEITTGVLPAHAQTSACVTVTVALVKAPSSALLVIDQGPLPSSEVGGNYATNPSHYFIEGYQAIWTCMSGCLQLFFSGGLAATDNTWQVTVTGPNPSQNDYVNTATSILIDLATGLFSITPGSNAPGSCRWIG